MKFLVFCSEDSTSAAFPSDADVVHTSVKCLHFATFGAYELIAICLDSPDHLFRAGALKLASILKHNPHTAQVPILAIFFSWHRGMIEKLAMCGVEFVVKLDLKKIISNGAALKLFAFITETNRIEKVLGRLCPYLRYNSIDNKHDLITCRAYRDRLVVGRYLLTTFCLERNHLNCVYHQQPKTLERIQ